MGKSELERLPTGKYLVLFDGYCNLCTGSVRFILKRERGAEFYFASLDSEAAREVLADRNGSDGKPPSDDSIPGESLLLYRDGKVYDRSSAALRIAGKLRGLWPAAMVFLVVPKFLRDAVYKWVARNRYDWFGKREEACEVSFFGRNLEDRFLN